MYRLTYWFIAVRMFTGCFQYSINIYMHLALHQNAHSLTEAGCCGSRPAVRIGGWTTTSAPGSHGTYHHQFPSIGCTAYSHSQRFNDVTWNRNHLLSPDALFCLPINLLEPIILLHMCNWFRRGKRFNRIKWNNHFVWSRQFTFEPHGWYIDWNAQNEMGYHEVYNDKHFITRKWYNLLKGIVQFDALMFACNILSIWNWKKGTMLIAHGCNWVFNDLKQSMVIRMVYMVETVQWERDSTQCFVSNQYGFNERMEV